MNPILDKLADLIAGEGPEVVRVRLSPRTAPTSVIYELSDGSEEELKLNNSEDEIKDMYIAAKRFWERFAKLKELLS